VATAGDLLKRALVGRPMASAKLEHQLLPKTLALPVFSSDPLSSVAYATEEMMLVLATAGIVGLSFMLPLGLVIAVILLVVVTSYRQTVLAYPRGGGSYIAARENLGTIPGLIAAAAILIGYVVTAAVSVTAGAVAVTSAVPALAEHRVSLALAFIVVIALLNLRGVRESGLLFAVPTYGFVLMIYAILVTGFIRCLGGCPQAASSVVPLHAETAVGLFLLLRALTQGSSALTGVEAIADGVQAFRRPQGRNASRTLAVMAAMSISMFLGITLLARLLDVHVNEEIAASRSVLSQIAETVFGRGGMFFAVQVFTTLILIVAANTAYQDFPRLSAILARDRFVPGQFKNRGDRLVFSNGVIFLSILAGLMVWAFDARLTGLIPLYLVGVFTAFTLSQAGMVVRWRRLREGRWKRNATINAIGASTTGLILAVGIVTRFRDGAWMVIAAIPVLIAGFLAVQRHYTRVHQQLRRGRTLAREMPDNTVVVLIADMDLATRDAVSWLRAVRPERVIPLYLGKRPIEEIRSEWATLAPRLEVPQRLEVGGGRTVTAVRRFLRDLERGPDDFITVVVTETLTSRSMLQFLRKRSAFFLKAGLLFERGVVVVDIPFLPQERSDSSGRAGGARALEPERNVCIVPVAAVHDATIRALDYARTLNPVDLEAVFFASDPEEVEAMLEEWNRARIPLPLSIVEAPFREYAPPLLEEVRRHTGNGDTIATVVIPEFVLKHWWEHFLHNQTPLFIKRLLLFEPEVVVVSVPVHLD
jgi:amino acid transporter